MASTLTTTGPASSSFARFRRSLDRQDRRSLLGMGGFILLLHVVGFGVLFGLVVPHHFRLSGEHPVFGVGVGILAYTFGLRHAFDADHIAAVDNATRKLLADNEARRSADRAEGGGRKPLSVGFWFSLGHSSIVLLLAVLLSLGVKAVAGQVTADNSALHSITGVLGATISGLFLWVLGVLNLVVLLGIVKIVRQLRAGRYDERQLEQQLNNRGLLNRLLGGLTKSVRKAWHTYPIGVLFGLGFDTATEVGLLVLAGGVAAFELPFYTILVLPVLFAAGMCLMDTIDGVFMTAAYGWAFASPARKIYYNVTITALSVTVALVIGTIELAGALADQAHIDSGPIRAIAQVPLDYAGYVIAGLFLFSWAVAVLVWRYGRIEERWSARLDPDLAD